MEDLTVYKTLTGFSVGLSLLALTLSLLAMCFLSLKVDKPKVVKDNPIQDLLGSGLVGWTIPDPTATHFDFSKAVVSPLKRYTPAPSFKQCILPADNGELVAHEDVSKLLEEHKKCLHYLDQLAIGYGETMSKLHKSQGVKLLPSAIQPLLQIYYNQVQEATRFLDEVKKRCV